MTFRDDGVQIFRAALSPEKIEALKPLFPENAAGQRSLLRDLPAVRELAHSAEFLSLVAELGCPGAWPVRAVFFDKNLAQNWKVPWHQDLSIAVAERRELPGFSPWSQKDGTLHVQPPTEVLQGMVTLRLHLDDCGSDNGPLRVIPGSHREGKLSPDAITRLRDSKPEQACIVSAGDVVAMSPLILHASSPAASPRHRRVIHIEYTAAALPGGLEWCEAAPLHVLHHFHVH